tara:strand:+ start:175 stop:816 length:642 start_codon:yes stop_codon:yes gene_type:complete
MIIIIIITILLIALLAILATPSVKLHNNYQKTLQIILPLIIVGLGIFLTKIIMDPIKFEKEKNYRYNFVKQKLIDIRSAELAFKEKNGFFTSDFEKLIPFVKLDSFVIVEKTDTLIEYFNDIYREYQFKDTMLIDTLGKVNILDSLFFKNYPIDSLAYVPFGNGIKFQLSAGTINKSKITVPVFEAKDPKPYDPNDPLVIGSMFEAHLNGNWQ